jgi:hypothetical protein
MFKSSKIKATRKMGFDEGYNVIKKNQGYRDLIHQVKSRRTIN